MDAALRLARGVHDDGAGKLAALRDAQYSSRSNHDEPQRAHSSHSNESSPLRTLSTRCIGRIRTTRGRYPSR